MRVRALLVAILFVGAFLSAPAAAPVNDDFENRIVLTGSSQTFTGTLQNATIQTGEPLANNGAYYYEYSRGVIASDWWTWTAGSSEPVTIEVLNFSTNDFKLGVIDVWTGTNWSSGFTFVGGMNLDIGRHPYLTFSATAGTAYQIRTLGTNYGDFTLKLTQTNLPIIFVQPFSRTVSTNGSVFFGVMAAGRPPASPPFSYQWRLNGVDMSGETFPILSMNNLTTNQSGNYSVMISNAVGGTLSDSAFLNVTDGTTAPALTSTISTNGQFAFGINGESGRLYRLQSSSNLVSWSEEKSFPKEFIYYTSGSVRQRNGVVYASQNPLLVPQASQQNFYRTTNYAPPLAACINNLAVIRFAKESWALDTKTVGAFTPVLSDLNPYFNSSNTTCPLGGSFATFASSYSINSVRANPSCQISTNHVLEQPEY
jgi:hypothetical protein